jgi:lysophospholipase L1-like esterase
MNRRDFLLSTPALGMSVAACAKAAASVPAVPAAAPAAAPVKPVDSAARIRDLLKKKDRIVWLITGDSITHGAMHTHGWRSYPEIAQERLRWELGRHGDVVINTGISGHCAADITKDFEARVGMWKPQVVSVNIGMNDAGKMDAPAFAKDLDALLDRVAALDAALILHVPNPIRGGGSGRREKNLAAFGPVIRAAAAARQAVLADHEAHWKANAKPGWHNDPVHPNGLGHLEMARVMLAAIGLADKSECLRVKIP